MSENREVENPMSKQISRRTILGGAVGLAGVAAAGAVMSPSTALAAAPAASEKPLDPALFPKGRNITSNKGDAIATTDSGKIKGFVSRGIYTFKGVPYGDDTGGANRFVVAQKVKPWTGVRNCLYYGHTCPTGFRNGWNDNESAWMFHWSDGIQGEDCLKLNVWTPSITDNAKRAVMVWIHGGGYTNGSSEEQVGYDGENLSKRGDVVVVSVNHRLNVLGFMNLEKYGEKFKHSGNISQLDLVAALQWVKANIANFGGDPNKVTIFGQSGGGGKVSYLMGMPAAQGLFHRAIIESGSQPRNPPKSLSVDFGDFVMEELNIPAAQFEDIQKVPYPRLLAAAEKAVARQRAAAPPPPAGGLRTSASSIGWQPYVDGEVIPGPAFYPTAPEMSKNIPVLIGSTLNEFVYSIDHPEWEDLTWEELHDRVEKALPGKGAEAIKIYRANSPNVNAFGIWSQMNATTAMRRNAVNIAKQKSAQGGVAYNYQFRWKTPVLDGRPGAFHCSEIAFAFYNTDVARTMTGGGDDARALSAKVSDAWIAFAKTGNPNHPGLPKWDPVSGDKVPTMCFDNECDVHVNHDAEELRITLS